ncbi:MAG: SUMF1/EgtB/PvdO family nonheme iron enzyme [Rhodospirillaceae bacterium]|jgi:toxoflavin biosynthesis protein ToxD|nr:SUMF1/EgtB/PvdO family nonheme iron enzyme [Rhodospirillaceae bacterium]MBT6203542.1 SUMF1/EgtB/PvdO family nonheme iron enzyme [Rhodospirillaceae bacterium]MBT6512718.1 SUMF1/EgtB/PvdO family nonheme iron enzyme [Rhodospirillaceae bacterium]MBT7611612.1 SUMF1/EgtB/PvdO family nonheme iron enzyme [Rhodospirillaceae bacterium]
MRIGHLATLHVMLTAIMLGLPHAGADDIPMPDTIAIPAGAFIAGSDSREQEAAYLLDEAAYGHTRTRQWGWYDDDMERHQEDLPDFRITTNLITQTQYAAFVEATGYPAPDVDKTTWDSYGLIHPYERTRPYAWTDGTPPPDKLDHPVVLVDHADAEAFAAWLSLASGQSWRLPTDLEWEKAARGTDGRMFPWGNVWNPELLNSHDAGPFATVPVGSFPDGASPFGMLDPAGQVFEWTATQQRAGRYWVKGGSWDDRGCGVCRPADRHGRPEDLQHILIGFRLVLEP